MNEILLDIFKICGKNEIEFVFLPESDENLVKFNIEEKKMMISVKDAKDNKFLSELKQTLINLENFF